MTKLTRARIELDGWDVERVTVDLSPVRGWSVTLDGTEVETQVFRPLTGKGDEDGGLLGKVLDGYIEGASIDDIHHHLRAVFAARVDELAELGIHLTVD